ncbi:MAG: hypothetical protein FJW88_06590 [Actinobacteria bacterium]|nr:hypothetical protein [Actinomycetota bacterium]
MAAVMTTHQPAPRRSLGYVSRRSLGYVSRRSLTGVPAAPRRAHLHAVPDPAPAPGVVLRRRPRVTAATFRRRRLAVALAVAAVVLTAGRAGASLGSSPLAAPERRPSVTEYVVEPGDSLWTVAGELAPDADPRAVVDALTRTRGEAPLLPGEVIRWQR